MSPASSSMETNKFHQGIAKGTAKETKGGDTHYLKTVPLHPPPQKKETTTPPNRDP